MAQETRPGRVIGDRYRLDRVLRSGGFGQVWVAHDLRLDLDVAVKEVRFPPEITAGERADRAARAQREGRHAAQLREHPNIVSVHDVVVEDDIPWTIMQLVAGVSLAEKIAADGPLTVSRATEVATSLLDALRAAHARGIVHRDIKPANVMLADSGEVLLTDFGIAVSQADTMHTGTGVLIGSLEYIAPERALGERGAAPCDLFSLGVTLYQAITRVSPFRREPAAASLHALLSDQPPVPTFAGGLGTVIMRLMVKDPAQRPTAAEALALLDGDARTVPPAAPSREELLANAATAMRALLAKSMRSVEVARGRVAPSTEVITPQPRTPRAPTRRIEQPNRTRNRRQATDKPPEKPAAKKGGGAVVVVLIVIGLVLTFVVWGRDGTGAGSGDCVHTDSGSFELEPCSLPWPFATSYKVLMRIDPWTPAGVIQCKNVPGWAAGDQVEYWPATSSRAAFELCLAPLPKQN